MLCSSITKAENHIANARKPFGQAEPPLTVFQALKYVGCAVRRKWSGSHYGNHIETKRLGMR
ncbi:hypothetical protein GCM10022290_25800 [Sagittula marina]